MEMVVLLIFILHMGLPCALTRPLLDSARTALPTTIQRQLLLDGAPYRRSVQEAAVTPRKLQLFQGLHLITLVSAYDLKCALVGGGYQQFDAAAFPDGVTGYGAGAAPLPFDVQSLGVRNSSTSAAYVQYSLCYRVVRNAAATLPGQLGCAASMADAGVAEFRFMYKERRSIPVGGVCGGPSSASNATFNPHKFCMSAGGEGTSAPNCAAGGICMRPDSQRCLCENFTDVETGIKPGVSVPFGATVQVGDDGSPLTATQLAWTATYLGIPISQTQSDALTRGQALRVCLTMHTKDPGLHGLDLDTVSTADPGTMPYVVDLQIAVVSRVPISQRLGADAAVLACGQQVCGDAFTLLVPRDVPRDPIIPLTFIKRTTTANGTGDPLGSAPCSGIPGVAPFTTQGCVAAYFLCHYSPLDSNINIVNFCKANSFPACPGQWAWASMACGYGLARRYCCAMPY